MGQSRRSPFRLSLLAAAGLLSACASGPLVPDRSARAPELSGFGRMDLAISQGSPAAQRWFAQGMAQAYAFNEVEAVRAFKAGLAQDPDCAMCAWGVAWQLGPNINAPDRGNLKEALRHVDHALRHSAAASPREQALIASLALRYGHGSQAREAAPLLALAAVCGGRGAGGGSEAERADPLDIAYAERMRQLVGRFPDDADILSLYAEAELVATREDWWDPVTGKPAGRIGELADRLEAGAARWPQHTGLNHYLIHTVDAVQVAHRAVAAADRLGALAPRSPHLLHMPSHTYAQVGRYADAERVNAAAMAAEDALDADTRAQGFAPSKDWRGHNGHFQWYAALMEGRGDHALALSRAAIARGGWDPLQGQQPLMTLMRLERWDAVLAEPAPVSAAAERDVSLLLSGLARGTAQARQGRQTEANESLAQLTPIATRILEKQRGEGYVAKRLRGLAEMAQARLRAELALADGRFDQALAQQTLAAKAAEVFDSDEPPLLAAGARIALGDMQLRARQWAAAEQSFRADLTLHPHSGWALRGLAQALQAQGRVAEALATKAELRQAWPAADAALLQPPPPSLPPTRAISARRVVPPMAGATTAS